MNMSDVSNVMRGFTSMYNIREITFETVEEDCRYLYAITTLTTMNRQFSFAQLRSNDKVVVVKMKLDGRRDLFKGIFNNVDDAFDYIDRLDIGDITNIIIYNWYNGLRIYDNSYPNNHIAIIYGIKYHGMDEKDPRVLVVDNKGDEADICLDVDKSKVSKDINPPSMFYDVIVPNVPPYDALLKYRDKFSINMRRYGERRSEFVDYFKELMKGEKDNEKNIEKLDKNI